MKKIETCGITVQSEKGNILEFNQYIKSDEIPHIIYADLESSVKKNRHV